MTTTVHHHVTDAFTMVHSITLTHGNNAEVWDVNGKRYLDFVGGIGVLNFGHCNPVITRAIHEQADKLIHYAYNAAGHEPYQKLMPALCQSVPIQGPLFGMLTNSGAESVENALKVVRMQTGRAGVIAFDGGFHGRTLGAVNLNGKVAPYKKHLGTLLSGVYHLPYPSADNGVDASEAQNALERLLAVETDVQNIGAVIFEPVQGEGGFLAMDKAFAQFLRAFCDEHGIVLIADEIQSGFGRTGQPFAFVSLDIEPDLVVMAKSMAGGLPLGALIGKDKYMNGLLKGTLGGTYSGNPVACAAALAVLDIMRGDELWQNAQHYQDVLEITHRAWQAQGLVGKMTGVGAMRGIWLNHPAQMNDLLAMAREQGLLLMPSGSKRDIIRLLPPLTIEPERLDEGLAIFERCLRAL